jgi:hypothetical protein
VAKYSTEIIMALQEHTTGDFIKYFPHHIAEIKILRPDLKEYMGNVDDKLYCYIKNQQYQINRKLNNNEIVKKAVQNNKEKLNAIKEKAIQSNTENEYIENMINDIFVKLETQQNNQPPQSPKNNQPPQSPNNNELADDDNITFNTANNLMNRIGDNTKDIGDIKKQIQDTKDTFNNNILNKLAECNNELTVPNNKLHIDQIKYLQEQIKVLSSLYRLNHNITITDKITAISDLCKATKLSVESFAILCEASDKQSERQSEKERINQNNNIEKQIEGYGLDEQIDILQQNLTKELDAISYEPK